MWPAGNTSFEGVSERQPGAATTSTKLGRDDLPDENRSANALSIFLSEGHVTELKSCRNLIVVSAPTTLIKRSVQFFVPFVCQQGANLVLSLDDLRQVSPRVN